MVKHFIATLKCTEMFCNPSQHAWKHFMLPLTLCGHAIVLIQIFEVEYLERFVCPLINLQNCHPSPKFHKIFYSPPLFQSPLTAIFVDNFLNSILYWWYCRLLIVWCIVDYMVRWNHQPSTRHPSVWVSRRIMFTREKYFLSFSLFEGEGLLKCIFCILI